MSYKQICYQVVNTTVMGLLVLISVFISLYCIGIFFPCTAADLGHSLASCTGQGSSCFLQALCRSDHVSPTHLLPLAHINGRAVESPWVSPCWDAHEDGEGQGKHSLPGSSPGPLLGAGPTSSCWLKKQASSHRGGEKARTLRGDNPSPQVLLNGEGAATSG